MPTNKDPKGDSSSHLVTDPNQVINSTNTQPDYYTDTLNRDFDSEAELSTTGTSGLDDITDEVLDDSEELHPQLKDDLAQLDDPDDEDGPSTTTDTARFTDLGGTYERTSASFNQGGGSANAGTPGHWGVDEDTD